MRQAFLIMAHHGPEKLEPLVNRLLQRQDDRVVVHIDRRSRISDETLAGWATGYQGRLRIAARVPCRWGHHSLVKAMMSLIDATDPESYDYAHLLSGQDWPVISADLLTRQIEPGRLYLSFEQPAMVERMTAYHFNDFMLGPNAHRTSFHYRFDLALRRAGKAWTQLRGPRRCPLASSWQKGSQWWSLPQEALIQAAPRIRALIDDGNLRHTQCSDEHVMQTVLAALYSTERISDNRRFIRWGTASSPDVLTSTDAPLVRASTAWFMRKVDADKDNFFLSF